RDLQDPRRRERGPDPIDLLHRPVFVVLALDGEYGTLDPWQVLLYRPAAELRDQPDVVPAAERPVHVVVMARQARAEVTLRKGRPGRRDARDGDLFDHHVGRHQDDGGHLAAAPPGVD